MIDIKNIKLNKKIIIISLIVFIILLIILSLLSFNKKQESIHVNQVYAKSVSEETIMELLDLFNTQNYYDVKEIYLPYQRLEKEAQSPEEIVAIKQKFVMDFALYGPYIFEAIAEVEQTDSGTIKGEVFFKDNSQLVNYIEEYEAGWKNFGVQNLAEFEIVKENGEMKINKFIVKETYTYLDVTEEFLDKLERNLPDGEFTFMTNN